MAAERFTDGDLDGMLREHFAARVAEETRDTPPVVPRGARRRAFRAAEAWRVAGLAAAAAACIWAVGSGWGRSPLPEAAARFAAAFEVSERIGEGLHGANRILSGYFSQGGKG